MNAPLPAPLTVLVSVRIDPTSGRATRSRADAAAVALAQRALGEGREPALCTAGNMPEQVARDYLALGIGQITRLALRGDADLAEAVAVLAPACAGSAVVLAGARAESGLGSGLLPYALAHRLQRPVINEVIDLQREVDGGWRVVQALPRGARRSWRLDAGASAVLVASPRLAQREDLPQRHSWAAAQAGRVLEPAIATAPRPMNVTREAWQFEPARKQRRALAPVSMESGAARMARATGSGEPAGQAGTVVREGTAMDKARLLLEHLRKRGLVQQPG